MHVCVCVVCVDWESLLSGDPVYKYDLKLATTVPADALAPVGAMPPAGTELGIKLDTDFRSFFG